jgi:hypothetical protein
LNPLEGFSDADIALMLEFRGSNILDKQSVKMTGRFFSRKRSPHLIMEGGVNGHGCPTGLRSRPISNIKKDNWQGEIYASRTMR